MPTRCAVPECSHRGGHQFPADVELRDKWVHAIRRAADKRGSRWTPKAKPYITWLCATVTFLQVTTYKTPRHYMVIIYFITCPSSNNTTSIFYNDNLRYLQFICRRLRRSRRKHRS